MSLFVAGTDTGIGKTVVSAILALKFGYAYWKPVQSGCETETDSAWVTKFLGKERVHPEAYRLTRPLSPHESARLDGITLDMDRILSDLPRRPAIVEGAGGILTPLHERFLFVDLLSRLGLPVVLVARTSLGTINHTLLSLEALRRRDIFVLGAILVGEENLSNQKAIEFYGKVPVLGTVPMVPFFTQETLERLGAAITLEENSWKK